MESLGRIFFFLGRSKDLSLTSRKGKIGLEDREHARHDTLVASPVERDIGH